MDKVTTHSAVVSKISSMRKNLLNDEDYELLIESVNKGESIVDVLISIDSFSWLTEDINSGKSLENALKDKLYSQIEKIYNYYGIDYKKLIAKALQRFEVEHIKRNVRRIVNTSKEIELTTATYTPKYIKNIDYNMVSKASTLEELIDSMNYEPYIKVIRPLINEENYTIFEFEMHLDQLYFLLLFRSLDSVNKMDKKVVLKSLEDNIDILNANWIIRAKTSGKTSPEEMFGYTLYRGRRFTNEVLREMCYMKLEELNEFVRKSPYSFLVDKDNYLMDVYIDRYILASLNQNKKKYPLSIINFFEYVHRFEYQIRDILVIKEMKSLGIDVEEALVGRKVKSGN